MNEPEASTDGEKVAALREELIEVREVDTVSRYGGDEFLILLSEITHATEAVLVADKVIAALDASTLAGEHAFRLTASAGISLYPDHGDDPDGLVGRADAAMYDAKRQGQRRGVFNNNGV